MKSQTSQNQHTLIITEKPSVGRDIARLLNCKIKGDGFLKSDTRTVTWAVGHLVSLKDPEDYDDGLKRWSREKLPILPEKMETKAIAKTKKQLSVIKKLMNQKEVTSIICATDSGREGELIFRYIYEWAKCKKPVKRLWVSSLTDEALNHGFKTMKDSEFYNDLYKSARCRAEADWLVGMNATRAFTIAQKELLPMGRVQTPTLAMIVSRFHEINNFKPKDYYEIVADFEAENGSYKGIWTLEKDDRTYDINKANEIKEKVANKTGTVTKCETNEKRDLPPLLYDLTELQRQCNRKFGFSAKKTLDLAQSLYESHKLITYPRTDSRYLSEDMKPKLRAVVESIQSPDLLNFKENILAEPFNIPARIINNAKVTDHHAIIPTGSKKPIASLSSDEAKVYDMVLRNFLAAFHGPYVYDRTIIHTTVEDELFVSKGKAEKDIGWMALYAHEKKESTDVILPIVKEKESVSVIDVNILAKKTQPPKHYTEATLLSAMENAGRMVEDDSLKEAMKNSGLGTPATRAGIIEKLITTKYIERQKKNLIPTDKGIRLIKIVPVEMREPETTGKWEKALSQIAEGKMSDERFMGSIRRYVCYLVQSAVPTS